MEPGLYIVATPIGNLADISQRAVEVLREVDLIAAEDTRHSAQLLRHLDITTPMVAYHDHSESQLPRRIFTCLEKGGAVALVADAGTPLISDPGYRLVRRAQEAGHRVVPIPGACAAIAALSGSGLPTDRFFFEGFLASKPSARHSRLQELASTSATLVFYEAPHRVLDCLQAMVQVFGPAREALLARELTKTFETLHRAPLAELLALVSEDPNQQRGEIVLIVAGARERQSVIDAGTARLLRRLAEELPASRAAAVVADYTGIRKKALYAYLTAAGAGATDGDQSG